MNSTDNQHPGITANENRGGAQTAPVGGHGRRRRSEQPYMLEDEEEKPLALMNGGIKDEFNDSNQPGMKAVLPPSGHSRRAPPRTAMAKVRPNKRHAGNSLNLHAAESKGSQSRLQAAAHQQNN